MKKELFPPFPIDVEFVLRSGVFSVFLPMEALDASGRTILEGRSHKYKVNFTDYRPCPYKGSRYKHTKLMNIGALNHYMKNKSSILSYVSNFSNYLEVNHRYQSRDITLMEHLLISSYCLYKAPLLWLINLWKGESAIFPPAEIAAVSKICHGIFELTLRTIDNDFFTQSNITSNSLINYVESNENLIGLSEVCAASPHLIVEFLECLLPSNSSLRTEPCSLNSKEFIKLTQFGEVSWDAEITALLYNYMRLTYLNKINGSMDLREDFCVSFPHALKLFEIKKRNLKFENTFINTYLSRTLSECESIYIKQLKEVFCKIYTENIIRKNEWNLLHKKTIRSVENCNIRYQRIMKFNSSEQKINKWMLELYWGRQPYL